MCLRPKEGVPVIQLGWGVIVLLQGTGPVLEGPRVSVGGSLGGTSHRRNIEGNEPRREKTGLWGF